MPLSMDAALLARIQFAFTIGFHYLFPPLTIGMSWLIFWMMTKYRRTGDEVWGSMARFWTSIFAVTFVVGVATGITMEMQFGMNWGRFSLFVGDVFGAPLAAEGILAFFVESIFVAALIYGWKRLSVRSLWGSSLLVALGATLSAFWILVANSWMQTPAGFTVVGGRATLTDFWAAVFNPSLLPRLSHTLASAVMTGAFFVAGVSAFYLLKKRHAEFARRSMRMALIVAAISSVAQLGLGHYHAIQVAATQPEKLATIEGVLTTQSHAPVLLFGIPDEAAGTVRHAVRIPGLLSLLAFGDFNAVVMGLSEIPLDERPPLALTFISFHLMVAIGLFLIAFALLGLILLRKNKLFESRWYSVIAILAIPLPFIANELGWITAEVGRQPWAVYHVLKTRDAISAFLPASRPLAQLVIFSFLYALIFAAWLFLVVRKVRRGPEDERKGAAE
ncbi:MAG: cytochrome ubiquinol oxidase subunit I [Pseudomonadota bacterium]